ncbi:MAG: LCP family protein [Patescibacteria group bacterium]
MPKKSLEKTKRRSSRKKTSKSKKGVQISKIGKYLGILFLVLFCVSVLGIGLTLKALNLPFASASGSNSEDLKSQDIVVYSLVQLDDFNNQAPYIVSAKIIVLDIADNSVSTFNIEPTTTVDVPGKFGEEPLSNAYALGAAANSELPRAEGAYLAMRFLEKALTLNIDRYILVDKSASTYLEAASPEGSLLSLVNMDFVSKLQSSIETNFTLSELHYIHKFISNSTLMHANPVNIDTALISDFAKVDTLIGDITFNSKITHDGESTTVLNGTTQPGLASHGSRVLNNAGLHVIATSNAGKVYSESLIIAKNPDSPSVKYIAKFFNISNILPKDSLKTLTENEIERSDITVILGLDIANAL